MITSDNLDSESYDARPKSEGSRLPCKLRKSGLFSLGQKISKIPRVNLKIFTRRLSLQTFTSI